MEAVLDQLPPVKGYSQRTSADKDAARACDKATHEELRALRGADAANKSCADCTASLTGWASLPHGVFLCIACAQVHRSLGRHMAQVKSFSSGTYIWYPDEVAAMRLMGNARAQQLYASAKRGAPAKPDKDAPGHVKDNYIRDKYERLKWVDSEFSYSSKAKAKTQIKKWIRNGKAKLAAGTGTSTRTTAATTTSSSSTASNNTRTYHSSSASTTSPTMTTPTMATTTAAETTVGIDDLEAFLATSVVTGQPRPTTAVYGGSRGIPRKGDENSYGSLLDDDNSTRGCKAACLPISRGFAAFKSMAPPYFDSRSAKWKTSGSSSNYGTSTATTATATAPTGGAMRATSRDDFFANWGL